MKRNALVVCLALLITACGADRTESAPESGSLEIPHYVMVPVDTIGIELGDSNYVFGLIRTVDFTPDGSLVVLDPARNSFSVFSPDGEFVTRAGRAGSGPGEFLSPADLCVLSTGAVAVSDPRGRMVSIFDSEYTFDHAITEFYPMAPAELRGADNGAIVGYQRVIRPRENEFGYALARWEDSSEPTVSYLSSTGEFNPEDVMSSFMDGELTFAVSLNGIVYAALSSTDSYEVRGYSVDGEEILLIERPFSPVEKTEEEIRNETEEFERMIAQRGGGRHGRGGGPGGGGFTFEPEPLKISIKAIFVDSENRIWVRDGVHSEPWFDVFDTDGRELFTSSVERELADLSGLEVVITPFGIAAYEENPLYFPRIYRLELEAPPLQSPEM
jgi:hypothetical protein